MIERFTRAFRSRETIALTLLAYGVALNGLAVVAMPVVATMLQHHNAHFYNGRLHFDIELLLGLTLLYLSVLLRRRKRTAWLVTMVLYALIFALNAVHTTWLFSTDHLHDILPPSFFLDLLIPVIVVAALGYYHRSFNVKSDIRSFAFTLRVTALVMAVTFVYGVSGFMLMDQHDFHHEITFGEAAHRTVDQFGLTTNTTLVPHTRRAKAFTDSLSILSIGALTYVFIAFFQPIRAHLSDQTPYRKKLQKLLKDFPASSEDFFKLWPHDKIYFFNQRGTAGLAYSVHRGMALIVGDPCGNARHFDELLNEFDDYCHINDWSMVFVHTEPHHTLLYKRHDFNVQKIGEEAVLNLAAFMETTRNDKYFRQIRNRFTKQGYTTELLQPPHKKVVLNRLQAISNQWLDRPGRAERQFMMGNFNVDYLQQGPIMVLRDQDGIIQAFINQIPSYAVDEANFDMLRHSRDSAGNSNDFILMAFIEALHTQDYLRLNLGLCPLAGLENKEDGERSVVDSALRFVYANGDRFYSFSGLHRFKAKYKPEWSGRYIAYRGRIGTFTKVLNALNRAMKV